MISPDSIASKVCDQGIDHAVENNILSELKAADKMGTFDICLHLGCHRVWHTGQMTELYPGKATALP